MGTGITIPAMITGRPRYYHLVMTKGNATCK